MATLIKQVCQFLVRISDMGLMYGNLRPENILVKFYQKSQQKEHVLDVKFLGFTHMTSIEAAH